MLEDITALKQAAVAMHELFLSLTEAGFTNDQAIQLIGQMFKAQAQDGNDS